MRERVLGIMAVTGTLLVAVSCLRPVLGNWSGAVVGPFGGVDPFLQMGLLEWSARTWTHPSLWVNLPIFYPVSGALGFMDSLVGQALFMLPVRWLLDPNLAALYNWTFLVSLILGAVAMGTLWLATGGRRWSAAVAALALVSAPYTTTQLGHLNQLPPPFVLFSLAALVAALRRVNAGKRAWPFWWLLALSLIVQAAWGWYGFSFAVVGLTTVLTAWVIRRLLRPSGGRPVIWRMLLGGLLPVIGALTGVLWLAEPQLQLATRYETFQRSETEVRLGSSDLRHLFNRGIYRNGPADWIGRGRPDPDRWQTGQRPALHPGWMILGLSAVGWWRRGYLSFHRRRWGRALLLMGLTGLVLSFGDSMGLPFTDRRLPLPLAGLREVIPFFKAFRGAWRYAWLLSIALAWWSAVGTEQLVMRWPANRRGWLIPLVSLLLMVALAVPAGVPARPMTLDGRLMSAQTAVSGPILSLPAPENEWAEDRTEARWLARALMTGRPVTGGATGWVPPEIVAFRVRLKQCEDGDLSAADLLTDLQRTGFDCAEIALRPGDERRVAFWRTALKDFGAKPREVWPHPDYETWLLP